jgi:spore germination cell wall hydrolase CwlJ-like protein
MGLLNFNFGQDVSPDDVQGLLGGLPTGFGPDETIGRATPTTPNFVAPESALAPTLTAADQQGGSSGGSFLDRLGSGAHSLLEKARAPDSKGYSFGDKLMMAGAYAQRDPGTAMAYQQGVEQRNLRDTEKTNAQAVQQALFDSMSNGKLDRAAFNQRLAALKTPVDLGQIGQLETALGPHRVTKELNDNLYVGDEDDPTSFKLAVRGGMKPVTLSEGQTYIREVPIDEAGDGQAPAAGGQEAPLTGAALGPSQARAAGARAPVQASPQDVHALATMLLTEAGGEGETGMQAVGNVALNRLASGYGGAKTLSDVVHAPHQFEGMTSSRANVDPNSPAYQKALQVAQGLIGGQYADQTNGATQFLNPELQAQLGRNQPAWASGYGHRIGGHVFYGGKPTQLATAGPGGTDAAPPKNAMDAVAAAAPHLQGGEGEDAIPAGLPPPRPGYRYQVFRGGDKPKANWTDLTPEEAAQHGALSGQRNTTTGELKLSGKPSTKPTPAAAAQAQIPAAQEVLQTIAEARAGIHTVPLTGGRFSLETGLGANLFGSDKKGYVGQSPAALMKTKIDTIKARLGFDQLNEMRKMSPTGGALGQVSERELHFLQGAVASLDMNALGPKELDENLGKIAEHYNTWLTTLKQAAAQGQTPGGGQAGAPAAQGTQPAAGGGPPASMLKIGHVTRFKNKPGGWTLDPKTLQPVQVQ